MTTRTEINAAIARAFISFDRHYRNGESPGMAAVKTAAELRAAEPASEPKRLFNQPMIKRAPPPSLVERLRNEWCHCASYHNERCLPCQCADALEDAQAWSDAAAESNKAIDAYLRSLLPSLPEHYGMPVDGIRRVFQSFVEQLGEAQAEIAELRNWRRIGRESADKLSEEFNRVRELEAKLVAAQTTDPNVESVRGKLAQRSAVGLAKYGCDTTRSDLSLRDWLNHLQEELMDAAVYVERLLALDATMERKPQLPQPPREDEAGERGKS